MEAALEALLRRVVREELANVLASMGIRATPEHATAKSNPLGSERAFLDAARKGTFPTFKLGREIAARWADVQAYAERRTITRSTLAEAPPIESAPTDPDEARRATLDRAGVVLRPARRTKNGSAGR